MLRRLLARLRGKPAVRPLQLRGRPQIRREKAYAADSGYVYQYTYEGYEDTARDGLDGRDFVFRCTSDRAAHFLVVVFAPEESFATWEQRAERELNEVERYAVVKMSLFEIFDDSAHLRENFVGTLSEDDVDRQVEALDL